MSQKIAKMGGGGGGGDTALLISSSNYAKRHINLCTRGDLCSPFFGKVSETPCKKVGFDARISFV